MARGPATSAVVLDEHAMRRLIEQLAGARRVLGPVLGDGVIGLGPVATADDLPIGWTDDQAPGRYRAVRRDDEAWFGFAVGERSWRREVSPPREVLVRIRRTDEDPFEVVPSDPTAGIEPVAWVGVRACDLAALAVTDRVFLGGEHPDPRYAARRDAPLLVAVDCAEPGGTCFCSSMGTGPTVDRAPIVPDLRVTEVLDGDRHDFVVHPGTEAGRSLLADLPTRLATEEDHDACQAQAEAATAAMGRELPTDGLREALAATLDDPHWDDVASRCLSCTNCTLVCPTCFCSTVEDTTDLAGTEATRTRVWDSCFTLGHSHVHGGAVHPDVRSRYRQWLTHKLDTWWDQFDTGGCVGCGRCVTWCPAGIDLTVEAAALVRAAERAMVGAGVDREGAS